MKRPAVAILAFLYIVIASGITVNIHYCMGDFASVDYGIPVNEACSVCGMKEKKGCCHTEYKLVKIQDAHQLAKINVDFAKAPAEPVPSPALQPIQLSLQETRELTYHSPPDERSNYVYLHNRVFRI